MKGNQRIIDALQDVLTAELTAINQYFIHAEMCENWGFSKLAGTIKMDSIAEMRHAESAIERMLFLEGAPNLTRPMTISVGQSVPEMFQNDLALEQHAVQHYNAVMNLAAELGDNGTRDMMLQFLKDEEGHVDFLETQLSMIDQMGLQNYLMLQTGAQLAGGGQA
jgi:bacterioferritin